MIGRRKWQLSTIAIVTLAVVFATYFGCYVRFGEGFTNSASTRRYESRWKLRLFIPAIWVEAHLREQPISAIVPLEMVHDPNIEECIVYDSYTASPW